MTLSYQDYLRPDKLPHVWCPGCGNGVAVKGLVSAVAALGWDKDDVVVVGGIGCAGRTPFVLDFNTMHTIHGRALAFATGVKLARPRLKVIAVMGDGDAAGIGGNHLIHACRRNIDLTAVVFNNGIYGQTGGQLAPTTPQDKRSATSFWGSIEPDFDLAQLALASGASFVARTTMYDFQDLQAFLRQGLAHPGFALVEVLTACPTYFGRANGLRNPYAMLRAIKERTDGMDIEAPAEKPEGMRHLDTGVFRAEARPEYVDRYRALCARAAAEAGDGGGT